MRARGPHNAVRLYAHIVWHTWRRRPFLCAADVQVVAEAISRAGERTRVRVLAQAVLTEHLQTLGSVCTGRYSECVRERGKV